jgi:hypothetical protein
MREGSQRVSRVLHLPSLPAGKSNVQVCRRHGVAKGAPLAPAQRRSLMPSRRTSVAVCAAAKQGPKKVVLAYSGGLDTSIILKWLQDEYGCEVVTFTADLGQVRSQVLMLECFDMTRCLN